MKKIILTMILVFCLCSYGFTQEHMEFMGIPITGNITTFINKLQAKGFKVTSEPYAFDKGDVRASLEGPFWMYSNCHIVVQALQGVVSSCWVNTPTASDFGALKRSLSEKYGTPEQKSNDKYEWLIKNGSVSICRIDGVYAYYEEKYYPEHIVVTYKDYGVIQNNDL